MSTANAAVFPELRVLVTGGTIDKTYSPVEGTLGFSRTNVLAMLQQARVALPEAQVQTVLLKDSLEMTDADRDRIRAAAAAAPEPRIILTHGTDTMILTAQHLAQANLGKTVVLVGAMVPYTFSNSDGLFNLGTAFAAGERFPKCRNVSCASFYCRMAKPFTTPSSTGTLSYENQVFP
jgi:L-asparaginase